MASERNRSLLRRILRSRRGLCWRGPILRLELVTCSLELVSNVGRSENSKDETHEGKGDEKRSGRLRSTDGCSRVVRCAAQLGSLYGCAESKCEGEGERDKREKSSRFDLVKSHSDVLTQSGRVWTIVRR